MTPADLLPIYRTTLVELRLKVSIGLAELRNSERRLLPLQVALENQELKLNEVESLLESLETRLRDSVTSSEELEKALAEERLLSSKLSILLMESKAEIDGIIEAYERLMRRWKFAALLEGAALLLLVILGVVL